MSRITIPTRMSLTSIASSSFLSKSGPCSLISLSRQIKLMKHSPNSSSVTKAYYSPVSATLSKYPKFSISDMPQEVPADPPPLGPDPDRPGPDFPRPPMPSPPGPDVPPRPPPDILPPQPPPGDFPPRPPDVVPPSPFPPPPDITPPTGPQYVW